MDWANWRFGGTESNATGRLAAKKLGRRSQTGRVDPFGLLDLSWSKVCMTSPSLWRSLPRVTAAVLLRLLIVARLVVQAGRRRHTSSGATGAAAGSARAGTQIIYGSLL